MSAIPVSVDDDAHVARSVREEQLRLLYRQSLPAIFIAPAMAVLLAWVLRDEAPAERLVAWLVAVGASMLLRLAVFAAYRRAAPQGESVLAWERPYALSLSIATLAWGVGAAAVMPVATNGQVFTFFVAIGVAGGAVLAYAAIPRLAIRAVSSVLLPMALWSAYRAQTSADIALAVGSGIFLTAAIGAVLVLSGALKRAFTLGHALEASARRLFEREAHFRFIAEASGDAIWTVDPLERTILYVSPGVSALLGYTPEHLSGRPLEAVMLHESLRRLQAGFRDAARIAQGLRTEAAFVHRDGHVVHAEIIATRRVGDGPRRDVVVMVSHDVSERKRDAESIRRLAYLDGLTRLPNRRLLFDRLEQAIARAQREGARLGLLFIDLDGFKPINDRHGHATGDAVLRTIAGRLQGSIRHVDTAARIGGDEFVVLLTDVALREDCALAAEKIRAAIVAPCEAPDGRMLAVGASIGIALFPDHASDPWALLALGDAAMYRAKRSGGNVYVYAGDDDVHATAVASAGSGVGASSLHAPADPYAFDDPGLVRGRHALLVKAHRFVEHALRDADRTKAVHAFELLVDQLALHFAREDAVRDAQAAPEADEHAAARQRLLDAARAHCCRAARGEVPVEALCEFVAVEIVGRHVLGARRTRGGPPMQSSPQSPSVEAADGP